MMEEGHMQTKILSDKTHRIYDDLTKKVSTLIAKIVTEINNKEAEETFNNVLVILDDVNKNVVKEYGELERNSEWDRFTIAFYGETNAGKSTIIEILRILWKDKEKAASIQKFQEIQKKYNLTQENFDLISKQIDFLEAEIANKFVEISKIDFDTERLICEKKEAIKELQAKNLTKIYSKKQWNKVKKNTKFDNDLKIENTELRSIRSERNNLKQDNLINYAYLKKELEDKKITQKLLLEQREFLKGLEDGTIIGDGRSDFTKTNTIYSFKLKDTLVDIIDVPGIEGNEGTVADEILKAVQKAHCVFYVTRKVTAPQTGDKKEGTIQKIKRHLGAQTEVWTIFNQSIKSTRRLNKDLVSEGELSSLKELNSVMTSQLGEDNYCGEVILSAHIAFLAVGECFIPGSKYSIEKANFTSKFSPDLMYELSGFRDFERKIYDEIITNKKEKILKSNYNKAKTVLDGVINRLDFIRYKQIEPLWGKMNEAYESAIECIDREEKTIKSTLDKFHRNWLHSLISTIKKELHEKIDDGVENEEIERLCKKVALKHTASMQKKYKKEVGDEVKKFNDKIEDVIKSTFKHYDKLMEINNKLEISKNFTFQFDFKSGFKPKELMGPIVATIIAIVASGGSLTPIVIAGLVVSWLHGLYKSLRGFFSDTYKKNQQKEAVDKFLKDMEEDIKVKLNEEKKKIKDKIKDGCIKIKKALKDPVEKINANKKIIDKTTRELKRLKLWRNGLW